jgi:YfiH family protein
MSDLVSGNLLRESHGLAWFEPLEPLGGIGHIAMTTRLGGISKPPYEGLNLGFHVDDVGERVRLNRIALRKALGRRLLDPVVGEQVHGTHVQRVGELHAGARWEQNERALAETDALVTGSRRLPLMTLVADCVPLALVDPVRQVGAIVHAGWRGLSAGIIENTFDTLRQTWGTVSSDAVAWIGPAIGGCCYEVGPEVAEHFPNCVTPGESERSMLNLRTATKQRLAAAGLLSENVTGLDLCTCCRGDLFFSHRRTTGKGGKTTGRQALLLWLEPDLSLEQ